MERIRERERESAIQNSIKSPESFGVVNSLYIVQFSVINNSGVFHDVQCMMACNTP